MRIGLAVEGSHVYHGRTGHDLLEELWGAEIPRVIGCVSPVKVFGVTKGNLAAMSLKEVALRKTTAISEPLDHVLERVRRKDKIDSFIVIWDLIPPWDKQKQMCRWTETLAFYEGLSNSSVLDAAFRNFAARRFAEMRQRDRPGARTTAPALEAGSIVGVCVEPLFESVFMEERHMRECLGVLRKRTTRWPLGWHPDNRAASTVIDAAVSAARNVSTLPVFRSIRGDYETHKTEWGIFFVRSGAFDESIRTHGLGRRLAEIRSRREVEERVGRSRKRS